MVHMVHMDHMDHMDDTDHIWVSGLVFGCLDLHLGIWTCILGVNPPPGGLCACRRRFFFPENDAPGIFEHVYCQFSRFSSI